MTEQTWWLDDVRFAAPPVLAAEVARALEERCGACRKIAYIGRGETPVPFWEGLRAATARPNMPNTSRASIRCGW